MAPMTAIVMKPPTWRLDWPNNVVSGGVSTAMTCSHPGVCVAGQRARAGGIQVKGAIHLKASIPW